MPQGTHKADGLFYVSVGMLTKQGACWRSREQFTELFGRGKIPVTLANLRKLVAHENAHDYYREGHNYMTFDAFLDRMAYYAHVIKDTEYSALARLSSGDQPRALMNLLWKIAQRRGLV